MRELTAIKLPSKVFGEATFMMREPLGLPASGKVHTWLPWPAQRPPCPETRHASQANYARQHCSVG
eukprot:1143305-Pelagomonas_calceolata.AAC.1